MSDPRTISDFSASYSDGSEASLAQFAGKVVLVVNTASKCGFTPQFAGLEDLWDEYEAQGLVVIGFPCNQFGAQEPGNAEEIASFCSINYGVSFPIMGKIEVNGDGATPLYQWLKAEAPGAAGNQPIEWNFTKFLIGRDGRVVKRFAPADEPKDLVGDIVALL